MKTKQMLLGLTLAIMTMSSANAKSTSTDWTAKLKPMTEGCYPIEMDSLSKALKKSIINQKTKRQGNPDSGETTIYTLKNATAFGQPLVKIEQLRGLDWGAIRLYFKDGKFMSLRPQFKLPSDGYGEVIRNDATGYQVGQEMGAAVLKFDNKQKTITCEY